MPHHEMQVVIHRAVLPVITVQHVSRVHLPPQLIQWPLRTDKSGNRPPDQHERVCLYRERTIEQVLPATGKRDLRKRREPADANRQRIRETRQQRLHYLRQVHLKRRPLMRQVVLVDGSAWNAVERDQRGVDLLQGVRLERDVFRYRGLHPGQEIAQRPGLGPVEGHGRDETAYHRLITEITSRRMQ